MVYQKTTWIDRQAPAINAARLNNIENGLEWVTTNMPTEVFDGTITSYRLSDGTVVPDAHIQEVVELQETKTIFGGNF